MIHSKGLAVEVCGEQCLRLSRRHRGKYLSLDAELLVARYKEPTMRGGTLESGSKNSERQARPCGDQPGNQII